MLLDLLSNDMFLYGLITGVIGSIAVGFVRLQSIKTFLSSRKNRNALIACVVSLLLYIEGTITATQFVTAIVGTLGALSGFQAWEDVSRNIGKTVVVEEKDSGI